MFHPCSLSHLIFKGVRIWNPYPRFQTLVYFPFVVHIPLVPTNVRHFERRVVVKKDSFAAEIITGISKQLRRRNWNLFGRDRIKIGKKTFYLDHEIPGLVMDTIENLNLVTRDKMKPEIESKRKTESGWYIVFSLPAGLSFSQFKKRQEWFSCAVKGFVDIQWKDGLLHMDIATKDLGKQLLFDWDPRKHMKEMSLPWPVGYVHGGKLLVKDLAKFPHCLIGGATNFGKSSGISVLVYSMLLLQKYCPERVRVAIVDMKGLDFYQLSDRCLVIEDEGTVIKLFLRLHKEYEKRKVILKKHGLKKIQGYKGKDLPYLVVIIDEFAELEDKTTHALINRAVRLYRAVGIHLVAATQRPSVTGGVMDGDTRAQFPARIAFKCADDTDSRIILGGQHNEAAFLPGDIPGRAFFNFGIETKMIQSMFITDEMEPRLLAELDNNVKWEFEGHKKLLPR